MGTAAASLPGPFKTVADQVWQVMDGWGEGVDAFGLIHPLPEEQLAHLDLFMAARHVSEMLWAIDLAQANPDFREQVDEWLTYAARHVNRYLDGE